MIQFKNVVKSYGSNIVLKNINLRIEEGAFITIVGVSGAGKSTLIEALIGNLKLDKGEIIVNGVDITTLKADELQTHRRTIGVVFQDYLLLPQKTVEENIAFAMEVCGEEEFEVHARVKEVLELVDMTNNKDKFPHQLSGGERQRVALARALVHNPRLIIADEPTGNLDPHQSKEIIRLLLQINNHGVTILLATHDKELVDMIQKRVVTINRGEIISDWEQGKYEEEVIHLDENNGIEIIEVAR